MPFDQNQLQNFIQAVNNNPSFFISIPQNPSLDIVASALALHDSLKQFGKKCQLYCPQTPINFPELINTQTISSSPRGKNLIISFAHQSDSIEKITSHIKNERLNIVIQPKNQCLPPNINTINYSYSGLQENVIIMLNITDLNQLGDLYLKNPANFKEKTIYHLSLNQSVSYTTNVLHYLTASCLAEMIVHLIEQANLPYTNSVASNLLTAIKQSTQGFSSPQVTADSFYAAYLCKKNLIPTASKKP